MTKTMTVTLPGHGGPLPASMSRIEFDGVYPADIVSLFLTLDANDSRPASFTLHRFRVAEGKPFCIAETRDITNMALTIEYQEDE